MHVTMSNHETVLFYYHLTGAPSTRKGIIIADHMTGYDIVIAGGIEACKPPHLIRGNIFFIHNLPTKMTKQMH